MSDVPGITGSGAGYHANMDVEGYFQRINTPAKDPEYFRRFHLPIIEHAYGNNPYRRITIIDIACGPAEELTFVAQDERIDMVATDISPDVIPKVQERFGNRVRAIAADVTDIPTHPDFYEGMADGGMIVNGMVYVPDKMLGALSYTLKAGALCVANFRDASNEHNDAFFKHYTDRGGVILDRKLSVSTEFGTGIFDMVVLEYADCMDDNGVADEAIRALGQQAYFTSSEDMSAVVELSGLTERRHETYDFASPVNPHNQVDVFTMQA